MFKLLNFYLLIIFIFKNLESMSISSSSDDEPAIQVLEQAQMHQLSSGNFFKILF